MFKGLGDMAGLLKQAQAMQGRMKEMQARLATLSVEGSAGGGAVTVSVSGLQKILSCRIAPPLLVAGDAEALEALVVAATNDALDKLRSVAQAEMASVAGGLDVPGLGDALGKLGLGAG